MTAPYELVSVVRCKNCRATGPSIASTEEEAIRLFNIRYDAPKQRRLEL